MLTYIGNKRALVPFIQTGISYAKETLGVAPDAKLRCMDLFSGSAVVARLLATHASELRCNDFELYAATVARACLNKVDEEQAARVRAHIDAANALADSGPHVEGILTREYAPKDTENIKQGERCFYTHENALRFDTMRDYIERSVSAEDKDFVLGALIVRASICANTSGLFYAFHKKDGVGAWNGRVANESNIKRIKELQKITCPVFNPYDHCTHVTVTQLEALACVTALPDDSLDIVYADPPYNEASYGGNYGLLNIIAKNVLPEKISANSGVPADWQRSEFYRKNKAKTAFANLFEVLMTKTRCCIMSYSDEGHVSYDEIKELLSKYNVHTIENTHARFSNTHDSKKRTAEGTKKKTVTEYLFVIFRKV